MRHEKKRALVVCEDGQTYARVTKMLGNGRLHAVCVDGTQRLCKIRGSMRKREWVHVGDLVLLALRDFQDDKADVVFRYTDAEARDLRKRGERLPADTTDADADEAVVDFDFACDDVDAI